MVPKVKFQINRFFWFMYFAENQMYVCMCARVLISINTAIT